MKVKVTDQGVIVPKEFFEGVEEVEIREANGWIMMIPMQPIGKRVAELHPGAIEMMSEDFDAPLPDTFWLGQY
jgi:virulence-associated protein VagC